MSIPPQPGQRGPGGQGAGPPQGHFPQQGSYPPPGSFNQPQWQPPQPPPQGNAVKWLLGTVAVLLVIAITVGVTVLVTRDGAGGDGPNSNTPTGPPVASADDDGPVEIITLEPTCQAWMPVSSTISKVQGNGWGDRDPSIPATRWTEQQRAQYEAVGKSMRESADQAVEFARQTPHRVIRQLYEQYVAYSRAYAESISNYVATDDEKALASIAASITISSVCSSISYGSAGLRSASADAIEMPRGIDLPQDSDDPRPFLTEPDPACDEVIALRDKLINDTVEWAKQDPNIPASQWSPAQRDAEEGVIPVLSEYANNIEAIGIESENGTLQDLALFAAVYFRAYVDSLASYRSADNYLIVAGSRAINLIIPACRAAQG